MSRPYQLVESTPRSPFHPPQDTDPFLQILTLPNNVTHAKTKYVEYGPGPHPRPSSLTQTDQRAIEVRTSLSGPNYPESTRPFKIITPQVLPSKPQPQRASTSIVQHGEKKKRHAGLLNIYKRSESTGSVLPPKGDSHAGNAGVFAPVIPQRNTGLPIGTASIITASPFSQPPPPQSHSYAAAARETVAASSSRHNESRRRSRNSGGSVASPQLPGRVETHKDGRHVTLRRMNNEEAAAALTTGSGEWTTNDPIVEPAPPQSQQYATHITSQPQSINTDVQKQKELGATERDWDWAGRGSSHIDFLGEERVPLDTGRFLGHGANGPVHVTICKGKEVAWKKIYCRNRITPQYRKEIDIIKKLSHHHIIELVGTYTKGSYLGLLLWPVAVCDLATFLDDVDYRKSLPNSLADPDWRPENHTILDRWVLLRQSHLDGNATSDFLSRLKQCLSCVAEAVLFLHQQGIKHKDLKPSNILLFPNDGLRITDFGTSSDVSGLDSSMTAGDERGTPKYFAPEVDAYNPSGRAADIFSLGCIFFEITQLAYTESSLADLKSLRTQRDGSFQANLQSIHGYLRESGISLITQHLSCMVTEMLDPSSESRMDAGDVVEYLTFLDRFRWQGVYSIVEFEPVNGVCCRRSHREIITHIPTSRVCFSFSISVAIQLVLGDQTAEISIRSSNDDIIYAMHLMSHSGSTPSSVFNLQAPFNFGFKFSTSHTVAAQVILERDYRWVSGTSPYRIAYTESGKSVLSLLWTLDSEERRSHYSYAMIVEGPTPAGQSAPQVSSLPMILPHPSRVEKE